MSSYNEFSKYYDILTQNVDYKVRSDYISGFFKTFGIYGGKMLDLACGSGSFSIEFAKMGYNVVGVDLSEDMLTIAQEKAFENGVDISFIKSDMRSYCDAERFDSAVCCLDSINHLTNKNDVQTTFNNACESLKQGGVFVFDVNTVYKHQSVLADKTFVFDEDDFYLVWDNEAIDDREIRILIDIFVFNGTNYDRFSEEFCERAYDTDELIKMLKTAGFVDISVYDELTHDKEKENSERLYFVCRKE